MGGGSWTAQSLDDYSISTRGVNAKTYSTAKLSTQQVFRSTALAKELNPKNIVRECRDSTEHPESFPIILGLDVTGSMGSAARKANQKLGELIQTIFDSGNIKDPEFCTMAIGDLAYDDAPIQMSQFESDIRIAEQIDKVYFEAGGGGNQYESYTAVWYMASRHTDCDCWKRGKKGVIITIGDELPNPYLPASALEEVASDNLQSGNIETPALLEEVREKYEVYHLSVDDINTSYRRYKRSTGIDKIWSNLLGANYYKVVTLDQLIPTIAEIIADNASTNAEEFSFTPSGGAEVSW